MGITFPSDITVRPATLNDSQAISDLMCACEQVDMGRSETVPADIEDVWEDTNLPTDSFVLLNSQEQIVGYSAVRPDDEYMLLDHHTSIHPAYRQSELGRVLLSLSEERARQLIAEVNPPIPHRLRAWAFSTSPSSYQFQLLQQEGYSVTSSEINLEIVLQSEPDVPEMLLDIVTRRYQPGQDERAIHAVIQESFQDIGGRPYRAFEQWSEGNLEHSYFDPKQLYVALAGQQIIGAITCRTYEGQAYGEQREGHITQLGVLRPWRKRGIARNLMQQVFMGYWQRDIKRITISVDAHNPTGALRLYQAMGMREYERVHNMLKPL